MEDNSLTPSPAPTPNPGTNMPEFATAPAIKPEPVVASAMPDFGLQKLADTINQVQPQPQSQSQPQPSLLSLSRALQLQLKWTRPSILSLKLQKILIPPTISRIFLAPYQLQLLAKLRLLRSISLILMAFRLTRPSTILPLP